MRDVEAALGEPDIREKFVSFTYERFPQTRDQFAKTMQTESIRFAEVIKRANASLD